MKFAYLCSEDAQRLLVDLRSIEAGLSEALPLDTAPILQAHQMYSRRTACLSGYVYGHPSLGDGREVMWIEQISARPIHCVPSMTPAGISRYMVRLVMHAPSSRKHPASEAIVTWIVPW